MGYAIGVTAEVRAFEIRSTVAIRLPPRACWFDVGCHAVIILLCSGMDRHFPQMNSHNYMPSTF